MALATPPTLLRPFRPLRRQPVPARVPAPAPVHPSERQVVRAPLPEARAAAGAWPAAARPLLADLAVAAMAASALAERCERAPVLAAGPVAGSPVVSWPAQRRAAALATHLDDVVAALRADLELQVSSVLPVLRTAPLGLRIAVVRASCDRVLVELSAVERELGHLRAPDSAGTGLRELSAALRRLRAALSGHRRLWTEDALPLARELLRERAELR